MFRFIENFMRFNGTESRKLDLSDMGLGDEAMKVVVKLVKRSKHEFSQLNLSKNIFKDSGLKALAIMLKEN
jgi:hypothetical protein